MKSSLTRDLGTFASALRFGDIPPEAIAMARLGFIDSSGCLLAGKNEDCVAILQRTLSPGPGDASLFLGDTKVNALDAAMLNATATHALDFDDTSLSGHPSAAMVPAIVAEAEHLGASGVEMLCAYVAGFEVWADLVAREAGQYHAKGWHPTSVFGAIAAAAACARLRKLDASRTAMAIALGASQSAGIVANFGTMAKPFHAGKAAHAGVLSARLAAAGMTASLDALEHPQGFLTAVSPAGVVDRDAEVQAGKRWRLSTIGLNVKKYPTCYCTHRPIDAMLEIRAANPALELRDVASITVSMSRRNAMVLRNARPQTGLEAKFSIEFVMVCALATGKVGLNELDDAFVQRPDIQQAFERVKVAFDEREDPATGYAPYDSVLVTLTDGRRLESSRVTLARGAAAAPLSSEEVRGKFMSCATRALSSHDASALYQRLADLEQLPRFALPARTGSRADHQPVQLQTAP